MKIQKVVCGSIVAHHRKESSKSTTMLGSYNFAREAPCIYMLSRLFSDSDIICENDLCERRKCCTFVAMSGLLPDIVQQVADLLLCLVPWEQLLLPLGHQWEGSYCFGSKEEEEEEKENSVCCEKE